MNILRSLGLGLGLLLAPAVPAWAGNCGGGIPCHCGDFVTTSYVMPADLVCPTGHGLQVANGRTLNCNGQAGQAG